MKIWYYLFNYTNKEKITGTESNLHFLKGNQQHSYSQNVVINKHTEEYQQMINDINTALVCQKKRNFLI